MGNDTSLSFFWMNWNNSKEGLNKIHKNKECIFCLMQISVSMYYECRKKRFKTWHSLQDAIQEIELENSPGKNVAFWVGITWNGWKSNQILWWKTSRLKIVRVDSRDKIPSSHRAGKINHYPPFNIFKIKKKRTRKNKTNHWTGSFFFCDTLKRTII